MRSVRSLQNAATSAARPIALPEFANALFNALGPACNNTVLKKEEDTVGLASQEGHVGHSYGQHSIGKFKISLITHFEKLSF